MQQGKQRNKMVVIQGQRRRKGELLKGLDENGLKGLRMGTKGLGSANIARTLKEMSPIPKKTFLDQTWGNDKKKRDAPEVIQSKHHTTKRGGDPRSKIVGKSVGCQAREELTPITFKRVWPLTAGKGGKGTKNWPKANK